MTRVITLSAAVIAMTALTAQAKQLSAEDALSRAYSEKTATFSSRNTISTMSARPASAMKLVRTEQKAGSPTVYAFASTSGGFMLVAADDAVGSTLLAYSDGGEQFNADSISPAMQWLLDAYSMEVATASNSTSAVINYDNIEIDNHQDIDPILPTIWGQTTFFNRLTPVVNSQQTPTGCVATAIAQCMMYHRWPEQPTGSVSSKQSATGQTLSVNLNEQSYDWDLMVNQPWLGCSSAAADEMSKLCYGVGVAFNLQYGTNGTSGSYMSAIKPLIDNFGYAESTVYVERDYFGFSEWKDLIYGELEAGRPVPYCGSATNEAHAFVIDGYRQGGYFHVNWGWYGGNDGYFKLTSLTPSKTHSAIAQAGYNMNQGAIIGLQPNYNEVEPAIHLRVSGDFTCTTATVTRTASSKATFRCTNGAFSMGYTKQTVTYGVKVVDALGNITYAPATASSTVSYMSASQTFQVKTAEFPTAEGDYEVYPAVRDAAGNWHDIHVSMACKRSVGMNIANGKCYFSETQLLSDINIDDLYLKTPLFEGKTFELCATISNQGEEYFDEIRPVLLLDGVVMADSKPIDVDVEKDKTEQYSWLGELKARANKTLTAGTTYMLTLARIANGSYEPICDGIEVTLRKASQAPVILSPAEMNVDNDSPFDGSYAALDMSTSVRCSYDIVCAQGYFGENVTFRIYEAGSTNEVYVTEPEFVGIEGGETYSLYAEVDLVNLSEGKVYEVYPVASQSGRLTDTPAVINLSSIDGTFGATALEVVEADSNSRLYPTMVVDQATVEANTAIKNIRIYSVSGESITANLNYDYTRATIGAENLRKGLYLVQVTTEDGKATVHRMLKR